MPPFTPTCIAVDDMPDNLEVIKLGVEGFAGQDVAAYVSPDEFLVRLERESFDIALIDLHMPPGRDQAGTLVTRDGFTLLQILRQDPRHDGMVMIAITADAMPADRDKALSAGFDGHIAKPVEVADLWNSILAIYAVRYPIFQP